MMQWPDDDFEKYEDTHRFRYRVFGQSGRFLRNRRVVHVFHKLRCPGCREAGLAAGNWWDRSRLPGAKVNPVMCTNCALWERAYKAGGKKLWPQALLDGKSVRRNAQNIVNKAYRDAGGKLGRWLR